MSPGTHWHVVQTEGGKYWQVRQVMPGGTHSMGAPTREAAEEIMAEFRANGTCRECGDVLNARYVEPHKTLIVERQLCFSCLEWTERLEAPPSPVRFVAEGRHYHIGPEPKPGERREWMGFCGQEFRVRFPDGREVVTHNLWTQGEVPAHFRERFPDTAVFVRRRS